MTPPTTLVYLPGKSFAPILPSETVTVEERIDPFPTKSFGEVRPSRRAGS